MALSSELGRPIQTVIQLKGMGIRWQQFYIKITEKLGKVIGLVTLHEDDCEIILSSEKGILNKQDASQIRSKGRATQGVKLINLKPGDRLVAIEKVTKEAD